MNRTLRSLFLILGALMVVTACGGGGGGGGGDSSACGAYARVINGQECRETALPVVQLLIDGRPGCTGTIITSDIVLTAAHCLFAVTQSLVAQHDNGAQAHEGLLPHPLYGLSPNFDLGLVLFPNIANNFQVTPARVGLSQPVRVGDQLKVIGYGQDGSPSLPNNNPRAASLRVASIDPNGITAFFDENNAGTCFGDSGGGATLDGRLVATVQGGGDDCGPGNINLFTNLQDPANTEFLQLFAPGVVFE